MFDLPWIKINPSGNNLPNTDLLRCLIYIDGEVRDYIAVYRKGCWVTYTSKRGIKGIVTHFLPINAPV